jgi:hypothetical protein
VQGAIDSIVSVRRNNRKHNRDVSVFSYGMLQIFRISAVGQLQARLNLRGFHRLTGFSSANEKGGLLYTYSSPASQSRGKRKQGLQPSEIKDQDERLSGALDFIHPLIKKKLSGFRGKPGFSLWESSRRISQTTRHRRTNGKMDAILT